MVILVYSIYTDTSSHVCESSGGKNKKYFLPRATPPDNMYVPACTDLPDTPQYNIQTSLRIMNRQAVVGTNNRRSKTRRNRQANKPPPCIHGRKRRGSSKKKIANGSANITERLPRQQQMNATQSRERQKQRWLPARL